MANRSPLSWLRYASRGEVVQEAGKRAQVLGDTFAISMTGTQPSLLGKS